MLINVTHKTSRQLAILTLSLHICKEIQSLQICELEKFTYNWSLNKNNAIYSDNLYMFNNKDGVFRKACT